MVHPSYGNVAGGFESGLNSHNSSVQSSHQKTRSHMGHMTQAMTLTGSQGPHHQKNSLSMGSNTLNHTLLQNGLHPSAPYESKVKLSTGSKSSSTRKRVYKSSTQ